MFCSSCGASLRDGQIACDACGRAVTPVPVAPAGTSVNAQGADIPTQLGVTLHPFSPSAGSSTLASGAAFGSRYHIIRLLGAGGMGAVYQAWDDALGVAVALKIVRPEITADPDMARELERRFKRELLLARQVTHKNVVRIHDLGEIDGIKYLTMPYIQGSDLGSVLAREKRLPLARALGIAKQVVSGLVAAHDAGVVHRDLKPANIMIDDDDNAVIMDFGIARSVAGGAGTVAGAVVGTLEYMAPEQAMAQPTDHRADIYALGLILYDMVLGPRQSSRAESAVAELMARVQRPLPMIRSIDPSLPEGLERIIDRCTQPDPAARYQGTAQLLDDLQQLAPDGRRPTTAVFSAPPVARTATHAAVPERRRTVRVLALVASIAVAVAALAWGLRDRWLPASPVDPQKPTSMAILPFRNATGDPNAAWLGRVLADMVRTELGQAPGLRLVASERLTQILSDLRVSPDADLDPGTLDRLSQFSNAEVLVAGQFVRFGSALRLDATLRTPDANPVALQAQAASEAEIPQAVKQLARAMLDRLSSQRTAGGDTRSALPGPTSGSMAALKAYSEGEQLARKNKHLDARGRFEEATREDPAFALGFARLAQTYRALGYGSEADAAARKAADLAQALPEDQKYVVEAIRAGAMNDTARAIEAYERLRQLAPNDSQLLFDLAKLYETKGNLDAARDTLKRVLELDPKYVSALITIGQVEIRRRNFDEALKYLSPALTEAVQTGNEPAKGAALHAMGVAFKRLAKPEDALRNYEQALTIRRAIGDRRGSAATLSEIGQVQTDLQRTDAALASYTESLSIRREINDKSGAALAMIGLGSIHVKREEYEPALDLFRQSLQIETDLGNDVYQALCQHNIASIYLLQAKYDDALTYFQQALQAREKARVPSEIAETLNALALTQTKIGQYEAALTNFLRALDLRRKANDATGSAVVSQGMAEVFAAQARYAAALDAQESAIKAFRETRDPRLIAEILDAYADTLVLLGRPEPARATLQEASDLAQRAKSTRLITSTLNTRGNSFYYVGDYRSARTAFAQAVQSAEKSGSPDLVLRSALNLAKSDIKDGRAAAAIPKLRTLASRAEALRLRPLAAECALHLGEALLASKDAPGARRELEAAVELSEKLGLRSVSANAHAALATALFQTGDGASGARHSAAAKRIIDAIRAEARTDDLLKRDDVRRIVAAARPVS